MPKLAALEQINFAVSDYLLGLEIPEFAETFGGVNELLQKLTDLHNAYELTYNTEEY